MARSKELAAEISEREYYYRRMTIFLGMTMLCCGLGVVTRAVIDEDFGAFAGLYGLGFGLAIGALAKFKYRFLILAAVIFAPIVYYILFLEGSGEEDGRPFLAMLAMIPGALFVSFIKQIALNILRMQVALAKQNAQNQKRPV